MTLDPLVTADAFIVAFPRDLAVAEQARLDYLLNAASNSVRAFCRRDFTATTSTIRVKPIGDKAILPNPPITSITSVKRVNFDGTLTGFAGWAWDGGVTLYGLGNLNTVLVNAPEAWTDQDYVPMVEVSYSHGDAEIPWAAQDRVIAMVARVLNQPDPANALEGQTSSSETVGPFNRNLNFNGAPMPGVVPQLSDRDKQILRDAGLTARTIRTVQLG